MPMPGDGTRGAPPDAPARTCTAAVHVTRPGPGGAALLADLGRRTYRAHFAALWSPAGLDAYLAAQFDSAALETQLAGERVCYYLACGPEGADPVGYAKVALDRALPVSAAGPAAGPELEKVYVEAAATRRGYGARLLAHVVDAARAAAQPCVWLDVLETNAGGRRLYERHDLAVGGELPFSTDRARVDFWVVRRALTVRDRGGAAGGRWTTRRAGTCRTTRQRPRSMWRGPLTPTRASRSARLAA